MRDGCLPCFWSWPSRRRRETWPSYTQGASSGTAVTFMMRPTTRRTRSLVAIHPRRRLGNEFIEDHLSVPLPA
jgi:hypothetical protein